MSTTWAFGPSGQYTATWDGSSTVTVTQTTGGAFVTSFAASTLTAALSAPEYQEILSIGTPIYPPLSLVATTGVSGYTLINGTGTILSWTAPNDGALHRFTVYGNFYANASATGGQINASFTDPGGHAQSRDLQDTYSGIGFFDMYVHGVWLCQSGSTVTVGQQSAMTAGGPVKLWAEIWAS